MCVCVRGVSLDCIDVLWTPPNDDNPPLSEKVLSKQATHTQYTTHDLIRSTAIDPN